MHKPKKFLHRGTAKDVFFDDAGELLMQFSDRFKGSSASAPGKGSINNQMSGLIMSGLNGIGVPTHFISNKDMLSQFVLQAEKLPLEVVVHNMISGDLEERLGAPLGTPLPSPVIEYHFISKNGKKSICSDDMVKIFMEDDDAPLDSIHCTAKRTNDYLSGLFHADDFSLMRCALTFGALVDSSKTDHEEYHPALRHKAMIIDEITLETCTVMDEITEKILDRSDYKFLAERMGILNTNTQ